MEKTGDTQVLVSELTGVPQCTISRFLSGQTKRVSQNILSLCKYAEIDEILNLRKGNEERRLSHALRGAIGDNPTAAMILTRIVESLTPLLQKCTPIQPTQPSGAANVRTRAR